MGSLQMVSLGSELLLLPSLTPIQEYTNFQAGQRRTYQEMRQKPAPRDTFFSLRNESQQFQRPTSVATEFVDTDWDEDDIISDGEDNSPRISLQSVRVGPFLTVETAKL